MDYMTLKEASEKWGVSNSADKLLLRRWPYSRCCEGGYNLADSERRGKACGYENEARKGAKKCKRYFMLKMI